MEICTRKDYASHVRLSFSSALVLSRGKFREMEAGWLAGCLVMRATRNIYAYMQNSPLAGALMGISSWPTRIENENGLSAMRWQSNAGGTRFGRIVVHIYISTNRVHLQLRVNIFDAVSDRASRNTKCLLVQFTRLIVFNVCSVRVHACTRAISTHLKCVHSLPACRDCCL